MVTSFRPRSALVKDDTVLTMVRPISDLSELYYQYAEYRLEMLEERLRVQLKEIRDRKRANRRFDTAGIKAFIGQQQNFLETMLVEIVDDDKVVKGFVDNRHLLSDELREKNQKKYKRSSDDFEDEKDLL